MSAEQTSRFYVHESRFTQIESQRFWVCNGGIGIELAVDRYKTRSAAKYAADMLNRGVASVDPHAVVGCKVVAA